MEPSDPRAEDDPAREDGTAEAGDRVVIARARAELYAYWRDFTNLPKFMSRLARVIEVDSLSSVWTIVDRKGRTAEWEIIVTDDQRDRLIAWSTSGRTLERYHAQVEFLDAPDGGTVVTATTRSAREPVERAVMQIPGDLARLKSLMEAGEPVRVREVPLPSGAGSIARERGVIAPERDLKAAVSRDLQSNGVARHWPCGTACANVAPSESTARGGCP